MKREFICENPVHKPYVFSTAQKGDVVKCPNWGRSKGCGLTDYVRPLGGDVKVTGTHSADDILSSIFGNEDDGIPEENDGVKNERKDEPKESFVLSPLVLRYFHIALFRSIETVLGERIDVSEEMLDILSEQLNSILKMYLSPSPATAYLMTLSSCLVPAVIRKFMKGGKSSDTEGSDT